jgi:hypothetical protein
LELLGDPLQRWRHSVAWSAPIRPEVNDDWFFSFQNLRNVSERGLVDLRSQF